MIVVEENRPKPNKKDQVCDGQVPDPEMPDVDHGSPDD